MRLLCLTFVLLALVGCATQRFGRQTSLSQTEAEEFTCRDIRLDIAKSDAFVASIRRERSGLNGAHVLGFLGDFGIGNVLEGNEAEQSGASRRAALQSLAVRKQCDTQTTDAASPIIERAPPNRLQASNAQNVSLIPALASIPQPTPTLVQQVPRNSQDLARQSAVESMSWGTLCRTGDQSACVMAEAVSNTAHP